MRNLAKLEDLTVTAGPSGVLPLALSTSCVDYKLSLISMAQEHAEELSQHEAGMERTRAALLAATQRKEVIEHVREREQVAVDAARARGEQKTQDELATQMWTRRQT